MLFTRASLATSLLCVCLQMVWEQGSVVIVNLTRLADKGSALCHRYWPEEGSDLYHIYEVSLHGVLVCSTADCLLESCQFFPVYLYR